MKFDKGLYTDCLPTDQPQGTYRFAKNIVDSNVLGVLENEDGFQSLTDILPYTLIGVIPVREGFVVFTTDNTDSEIGLVERSGATLSYTQVYNNQDLNFSTTAPIKGEFRLDVNGDRIVAWIDDDNKPRTINIDNPSVSNIEDLNLFQSIQFPKLDSSSINDSGGTLPTGAYIVFTKYLDATGAETSWFVHEKVFYINNESRSGGFEESDGGPGGEVSSKSITVNFTECDTAFTTIAIGYFKITNQIITPYYIAKKTNAASVSFTLTGSETTEDLSLEEVLTTGGNYNNAKAITQVNSQLILGNLTSDPLPELQTTALGIEINYTTSLVSVISNSGTHKDTLPPSLMPGEVYAFYLGVELNSGQRVFYHIPGRPAVANETDTITTDGISHKRYQISDTNDAGGALTNMGYWENENEQYPNEDIYDGTGLGYEDLRGQNVRHHRTPSVSYLANNTYSGTTTFGVTQLPRIGIEVSNVNIPVNIQSQIKRWRIFYAKKDSSNSIVVGSDLLHFNWATESDASTFWSTGGNWAIDAERNGTDTWDNFRESDIKNTSQRGHCLDLLLEPGKVTPLFAWFHYKLRRTGGNTQYTGFRTAGGRLSVSGDSRGQCNSAVIDFTVPSVTTRTIGNAAIRKMEDFQYLPQGSQIGKFKSKDNEACFVAEFSSTVGGLSVANSILRTNSSGQTANEDQFATGGSYIDGEDTMYMQYGRLLTNAHNSFTSQDLIPLEGGALPSDTTGTFYGGDTFLCFMSYLTTAPLGADGVPENSLNGVRMWKAYIGYSRRNWNYRHQTQGDIGTYYYGKTDPRTLFFPNLLDNTMKETSTLISTASALNKLEYNEDYNFMNQQSTGIIYSADLVNDTDFPTTLIYSSIQNEESEVPSWRIFPADNRYVMPGNKGEIVNLQGFRNRELIIHTEESFFRTRTDAKINVDNESVFLKSNDLFELPPEEVIPTTEGYAGTQHAFGCVLTKMGYFFPSDKDGKIFLYNGEIEEISTNGMRVFFRDFMGLLNDPAGPDDNPFTNIGYTAGYDERNNRFILTKKSSNNQSWTISYNPMKKTWTSFHSYIPGYMFNTKENVLYAYSSDDNQFFLMNSDPTSTLKGVYFGGSPVSSMLDAVFSTGDQDVVFTGTKWITESYPVTHNAGQPDTTLAFTNTFTHLTAHSTDHCTGRTQLINFDNVDALYTSNIRNLNKTWYFNDLRDIKVTDGFLKGFYDNFDIDATKLNTNMEWYDQRKFTDKFIICRYEYDNVVNNRLLFLSADIEARKAR